MAFTHKKVLAALRDVLNSQDGTIALHEPQFRGNEWAYVKECIDTGWVSSVGKFVDNFESMLVEYTGVKQAVAVVNGTAALQIALKLVGVVPDDEVLVPALTFVATANAVCYCGAIPHFVDSEEKTLGLDPKKLEAYLEDISEVREDGCFNKQTNRYIRAVVPTHIFGHPVDLDPLMLVCKRFHLEMVEDATEALGSLYNNKHSGHWGKMSALSFNGNKSITTGGGGAILTNDEKRGKLAKHLTTTAKKPHRWAYHHDQIGYNYRLPNINAALGCAQMEQLPSIIQKKRALAKRYQQVFEDVDGIRCFKEADFVRSNYWLNALLLDEDKEENRDALLEVLNNDGITSRPVWTLLQKLPMFKACPKMDLASAESLEIHL